MSVCVFMDPFFGYMNKNSDSHFTKNTASAATLRHHLRLTWVILRHVSYQERTWELVNKEIAICA